MKNEIIDKSKGIIEIVNHKIFKSVKNVFRDSKKIFSYTFSDKIYNIIPCNNTFYYTSVIIMDQLEFDNFINSISI